jgi:2-C-methyl-D-erythritol 4-phosphate cytidylyltransferase
MAEKKEKVGVVIAAGGSSQRMNGVDKLFTWLGGQPIVVRATSPFQKCPLIDQIVVVVSGEKVEQCRQLVPAAEWSKVTHVCAGGERRQDSVKEGLAMLEKCDWVIIHDGARPFVTIDLIERGLAAAKETGAAVAAVPVTDTIKRADERLTVRETPPRKNLWAVQTPQVFRIDIITRAYQKAKQDVTDDASLVEQAGYKVKLYMGSYDNIKITTPDDLILAEALLKKYER